MIMGMEHYFQFSIYYAPIYALTPRISFFLGLYVKTEN
jgi:hypothetical protein